jgi:hypothetical protein
MRSHEAGWTDTPGHPTDRRGGTGTSDGMHD